MKKQTKRGVLKFEFASKSDIPDILDGSNPSLSANKTLILKQKQSFLTHSSKLCQQTVPTSEQHPYKLAVLKHHDFSKTKRWYIEFSAWDRSKNKLVRKRPTEDLNRIKNLNQRFIQGEQIVRIINGQLRDGKVLGKLIVAPKPSTLLLEAVDYVREQKKIEGYRKNYYRSFLQLHTNLTNWLKYRKIPDFNIKEFDRTDATLLKHWLTVEKKLSNKTINNIFANLGIVFNYIEKQNGKLFKQNPLDTIDRLPVVVKKHSAFTDEQIIVIKKAIAAKIKNSSPRNAPGYTSLNLFISFIYYTLARPNEIMSLKVSDIQLDQNRIYIRGEDSKNKRDEYVPVPDALQMAIRESKITTYPHNHFIFGAKGIPSPKKVNANFFWLKHNKILKEINYLALNPNFTLYGYKHSGAISLYKATKDVKLVQQQCRHQSVSQTDAYLRDLGVHSNYEAVKAWKGGF